MTVGPFESDATRAPDRAEALRKALGRWRRELTGVGGPNTLLWYVDGGTGVLDLTTAHPGGVSMLLAGRPTRLSDLVRERAAFAEARGRAAEIRNRALQLRSRRGLETSFLAAGMASWEHPGASAAPQAPVLLRSCTLRPTDPLASDFDVLLGDEVEFNPVLDQYLRTTAGLDLDTVSLADLSTLSSGFDPYPVYAALAGLCEGLPGFTVTPRVLVGTFPHGKLTMVQDLADLAEATAVERLATHSVLSALAGAGDHNGSESTTVEPPEDLDPDPDPAGEWLVLDADAAQSGVVEAVLRGGDVAVQAPPGSGATQTIANLVAALAGQGNTVLLVAERSSTLDDVQARLEGVGLGWLVFAATDSLFDHRATLTRLVQRVDAKASADDWETTTADADWSAQGDRLREHRDALRDHVAALHEVRVPWGVSVHEAQRAIAELGSRTPAPTSRVRIRGAALARLSRERLHELADELTEAVGQGAWSAGEAGDPWYGARVLSAEDAERAQQIVARLASGRFEERATELDAILAESSLPPARTVNDWKTALATMTGVRDTLEVFRPEIFDIPLDEHVAATGTREYREAQGVELGWATRARVRRLAGRLLRPGNPPEDLHAELVRARTQRAAWYALVGAGGRPEISPRLDEAQAAYDDFDADLTWLGERLASTTAGGDLHATAVTELRERIAALAARPERLAVLPHVVPVIDDLRAAGMGEVVDDFAARGVEADQVTPELEHIWWVSIAQHVAESDSRYGRHNGPSLREAAEGYVAEDREHRAATARRIQRAAEDRRAETVSAQRTAATMLRAEAEVTRRPMALRSAFDAASELALSAAPCWAMSPLEVAESVPPGQWFDVVIVADAGTVTTATTVSALARARQVVAVGDAGSSGPTGYETSWGSASIAGDDATPPSLFDDLSRVAPVHRLRWAHGFADERLVELGSGLGYAGELVSVPARHREVPVVLHLVDGRAGVEPGPETAIDSTDAEVEAVVELVLDHARTAPGESLGVVTLTERHAERVRAALAAATARLDPRGDVTAVAFLAADAVPPVEVVSMGVAGGLSRDCVLVSVGYGKTPHGRVLHRFPALSAPDARRGLTTALTMARRRLVVVSAIAADDLDVDRLHDGGRWLVDLLRYAEAGSAPAPRPAVDRDSLMQDLAGRLRREGLVVGEGIGLGPRRVDLAVTVPAHEDQWLVAVEGDGPEYASWRGTRERDRLWPEALAERGWIHLRVWSTDLYRDPAREVARVVSTVRDAARALPGDQPEPEPADEVEPTSESEAERSPQADPTLEPTDDAGPTESLSTSTDDPGSAGTGRRRRRQRRSGRPLGTPGAEEQGHTKPASDTLPGLDDQTSDDTDAGWGEASNTEGHDRWLEAQRPPHWD